MGISDSANTSAVVAEVMSSDFVTVSKNSTMTEAAKQLVAADVDGAPVVDEVGRCVGVLSAVDFVRLEMNRESICSVGSLGHVHELIEDLHSGSYQMAEREPDRIETNMSPGVQTIRPNETIEQAIRVMTMENIHRLVVLDETSRPVGVVSAHDIFKHELALRQDSGESK